MRHDRDRPFYVDPLRRLLDFFIPAAWPEGSAKTSARNAIATSIAFVVLVGPFVPIFIWQGSVVLSVFVATTVALAVAVVLVMRYFGALRLALVLSVANSVLLCPVAWYLGGRDDSAFPYMYTLFPITCTFIFGAGVGFVSTLFAMALAAVMAMAPVYGWLPYVHAPLRNPELMHMLYLVGTIGAAGILSALFQFSKVLSDLALLDARRQSEELAAIKSTFLANMSHEIRTPMNAIIGLSGLALKNDMPPRVRDYLSKIKYSGDHLLGIINDILDYSKIESGKLEVESVPFDLEDVIDNVVNLVSESADAKGLEILCQVDAHIPRTLVGDPLRIGQILINLSNNAVKFTQQGEIRIGISMAERGAQQVRVRFEVQDTGIGLRRDQVGKLFKSFEQADASTTRQFGGTGLGLAISKSLAEAMGGEIGVHSVAGEGSTFWFTALLGMGSTESYLPVPAVDLHGKRVLVVDDNEAAGLVLQDTLQELGFTVDRVDSGPAALGMLKNPARRDAPYAFVMMDWLMPGMDGLETIHALRAMQGSTAPCVLMVTAHRRDEVVKGAQALGIQHVLTKPVSGSLLVNTMMHIMGLAVPHMQPVAVGRKASSLETKLSSIRGARLLLVEDNDINQQVACEILGQAGFQVDVAENGKVAVHQVQARFMEGLPYDLVLMDMQMPVMDGVAASRLIRETFGAEQLPIVAMTANAMKVDRDRCMDAGMNGFVTKPIDPEDLWAALLTWVKVREGVGITAPAPLVAEAPSAEALALLDALQAVPDLDVALGVSRTNNNPALYVSILRRMLATQADAASQIAQHLGAGDPATAERSAHTLKGLAANLGATRLQHSADRLEQAIKTGATPPLRAAALVDLQERLAQFVAAVQGVPGVVLAPQEARTHSLSDAERRQAERVVQQIRGMLQEDNAAALELWEAHAPALRMLCPRATDIEDALGRFEFEEALGLLG